MSFATSCNPSRRTTPLCQSRWHQRGASGLAADSQRTKLIFSNKNSVESGLPVRPLSVNLLTAVHLLYSREAADDLVYLIDAARRSGPLIIFAVCEAKESDFNMIRAVLREEGVPVARSQLERFVRLIEQREFVVRRHLIGGQECVLDLGSVFSDDGHWLFPFLVGCTSQEFSNGDRRVRETVLDVTRRYLASLPSDRLSVPDTAVIAVALDRRNG